MYVIDDKERRHLVLAYETKGWRTLLVYHYRGFIRLEFEDEYARNRMRDAMDRSGNRDTALRLQGTHHYE